MKVKNEGVEVRRMVVEHGPPEARLPRFFSRKWEDRSKYKPRVVTPKGKK